MDPSVYDATASGNVDFLSNMNPAIDHLHQKTRKGNTILHIAAEFKQIDFFKQVKLKHKSPPFWFTNMKGDTPLHVAARVGSDEIVKFVINHTKLLPHEGADEESGTTADVEAHKQLLRMANMEKETALHIAVRYSHKKVVSLLIRADPELCCLINSAGESPLFLAIRTSSPSIASGILEESPESEETPHVSALFGGANDVTALHAAVTQRYLTTKGIVKTMVSSLSKNPEMIKKPDTLGWTPLHYAALEGNLAATRELLSVDKSISYLRDEYGLSPLHVAAYAGHPNVIRELIQCRPDTCELVNDHGQTALHAAVLGGRSNVVRYILKTPKLAVLINEANKDGDTPLHLAAIHKNSEIIQILTRDSRVDIFAINKKSLNALDIFLGDDVEHQEMIFSNTTAFHLRCSPGVQYIQKLIGHHSEKLNSQEYTGATMPTNIEREKPQSQLDQALNRYDTKLLVATLIVTITFSAGLTNVPGGFQTDGTPVLHNRTDFRLFVIFNFVSFYFSFFAICTELIPVKLQYVSIRLATPASLVLYSMGGLLAAFLAGHSAVGSDRRPHESLVKYFLGRSASDYVLNSLSIILFVGGMIPMGIYAKRIGARKLRVLRRWKI